MEKFGLKFDCHKQPRHSKRILTESLNTISKGDVTKPRGKTNVERQRRFRAKQENCEKLKDKNIASCAKYRMKVKSIRQKNSQLDELMKKKERERERQHIEKSRWKRHTNDIQSKCNCEVQTAFTQT